MKNKIKYTLLATGLLGICAVAIANGYDPKQFAAEQVASMQSEQHAYDLIANKGIQDLQAFLKKIGAATGSDKSMTPQYRAPQYHAPTYHAPQYHTPSSNTPAAKPRQNSLPLNTNNSQNNQNNWSYQL